jgi:hypothetical protein
MKQKTTFWTKLLDWIIRKTFKEVIDYIKKVVDEATVAADVNDFGSWSFFLLNLMLDLLQGVKKISAPATKSASVHSAPQAVYRTQTAAAIKEAQREGGS